MQTSNSDEDRPKPRVQSLARGLALLTAIAQGRGLYTAKELSEQVGLPRQTTYHLLHTLRELRFVEKVADQRYQLGLAMHGLTEAFQAQLMPSPETAGHLRALTAQTGEACSVSTWRGDDVVVLAHSPGVRAVRVSDVEVGQHGNLHARASGKLLLAFCDADRRERIRRSLTFPALTPATITDQAEFDGELTRVHSQGFAEDRQEFATGISCVAALAIVAGSHFAFSVLAPNQRFIEHREEYVRAVLACAAEASTAPAEIG